MNLHDLLIAVGAVIHDSFQLETSCEVFTLSDAIQQRLASLLVKRYI